ncbi:MAG: HAMP domain-containing histidine kinase [Peptococcaceae bacterium]|nr:HAMP domain-containing histidine kinase [Peptococcaceae bacterium]
MKNKTNILNILRLPVDILGFLHKLIKDKLKFSISFRLSLNYLLVFLRAIILIGISILLVFALFKIHAVVSVNSNLLTGVLKDKQVGYTELKEFSEEYNVPVFVYDYNKKLLFASEQDVNVFEYKHTVGFKRTENEFYLILDKGSVINGYPVRVAFYSDIQREIADIILLSKITLIVLAVVTLFSAISIVFIGRGFFQPLKEMTKTVKDISAKNLNLRLNVSGSQDELKELALTFNEMMNRLEDHYNRQKQFVSDASHELRTPIAVIQGYTDMLDRWGKNDREVLQESIDAIKNEAENMRELIDKLLFLARHDKDNFVLQKEEFSLTELLQEIVKETTMIDSRHQISFVCDTEQTVFADRNRIKQAIRIFIDNAIKYTPTDKEIRIGLNEDQDYLVITVEDSGIGISKEELNHIFDRFYRAEQSRTKEKGGHGLGLAIAKIIVLGHGGKIRVRSKSEEGSEFTIFLPKTSSKTAEI